MLGLMQGQPLTTAMLIDHAARHHGRTEIVSRGAGGSLDRSSWAQVADDARRIAATFDALGLERGDRVATLAWNRTPHLALYFGVTAGGMVLHTVNPRLFAEQIVYIINHGGARILCVDPDLLPILEPIADQLTSVETIVVLGDAASFSGSTLHGLVAYDTLIARTQPVAAWPTIDENAASTLCYTSGTTGNPKGVLYSHRSTVLHSYAITAADAMALSARDTILLVTPLFHVNAWGVPFAAAMCGAKLVLPGAALDGASIHQLLRDERATFSLGVPTIWFGVLDHLEATTNAQDRAALALNRVFAGGAAVPRALIVRFRDLLGVDVLQAWGMTETSPVATVCRPLARHADLDPEARADLLATQGRALCGVELRIEGPDGGEVAAGSGESGLLKVRGPWVLNGYFGQPAGSALDADGWFDTGDIARIDHDGFLQLTDRAKDVIKSGGEWISSIDLENAAVAHPSVAEAAVIAVPHPRWQERPLLLVRTHDGGTIDRADMLDFLSARVARWWLPDDVVTVAELPHTATGKLLKTVLRAQYRDHLGG
ncbi:MAG: long-chain fatty acid--CoA ligase [Pseudomonadota bacterium]